LTESKLSGEAGAVAIVIAIKRNTLII
jgi:hypothetical protein